MNRAMAYYHFLVEFFLFKNESTNKKQRFKMYWKDRYPCLDDRTGTTGFDFHYIYHPAWAARIIARTKPEFHVDISSTLHFCTLVSAFVPVRFFDYRPAALALSNLSTEVADLTALPFDDRSIASLSCMHVVEHVGLGRYGDPLDYDGDLKAISELKRVLAVGGNILFVVPIGKPKILFNAHRIYSYEQILNYFSGFELCGFSLVPDPSFGEGFISNATKEQADAQTYGCGCFWFVRSE
jgi:SAM-dependent methyltransferase